MKTEHKNFEALLKAKGISIKPSWSVVRLWHITWEIEKVLTWISASLWPTHYLVDRELPHSLSTNTDSREEKMVLLEVTFRQNFRRKTA